MKKYVLGFLFNDKYSEVVLIQKNRPEWQAGRVNGLGGKVEEGESYHEAMVREYREEAGVDVPHWESVCMLNFPEGHLAVYYQTVGDTEELFKVKSMTDERVQVYRVDYVMNLENTEILPNLRWLIQMATSFAMGESAYSFDINEVR